MGIYVILELVIISILIFSITISRILDLPFEGGLFFAYLMTLVIISFMVLPAIIILKLQDIYFPRKPTPKKEPSLFIESIIPVYNPKNKSFKHILFAQIVMWGTYIYVSREFADVYKNYGALAGFFAVTGAIFLIRIRIAFEHKRVNYKQLIKETLINIIIFIVIYFFAQVIYPILNFYILGIYYTEPVFK